MKKILLFVGICTLAIQACDEVEPPVYGCINEFAVNFNLNASIDDGSCIIIGCMDDLAFNFSAEANIACDSINPSDDCCCYTNFSCFDDPSNIIQKILIEDFTGHRCLNCPEAAEELHSIQSNYPNQVIGIAIHAGPFAEPENNDTSFTTDFRTDKGNSIHDKFGPWGYPTGMINRIGYPNTHIKGVNEWSISVNNQLSQTPKMGICINESCETISINLLSLENISDPVYLAVAITEDYIIDWQKNDTIDDKNYEHNHVLRDIITPAFGDSIGTFSANEIKSYTFSYQLNSDWVRSNCNIVAYVLNATTQEIIQVEEIHLTE